MPRRFGVVLMSALALLVAAAPLAGADPAKPTNYRSKVLRVTPATSAITAKVVGGDGFLELEVERGHTATVEGYQSDPWLRVLRDGRVQENQQSTATYLNANRYGKAPIPPGVTALGASKHPQWKTVDRNGRYVWHDHRIHYMTPQRPIALVTGTNRVAIGTGPDGEWVVPMTVDGHPTQVIGELLVFHAPSPFVAWGFALLVLVAVTLATFVSKRHSIVIAAIASIVAAGFATWSGWQELAVVPAQAGGNPISVGLPVATILVTVLALALRSSASRVIALLAGAAALGAWALLRVPSFGKAVPLADLPPLLARLISAGALGTVVAVVVAGIASGGLSLRLPGLDDDEPAAVSDSDQ